MKILLAALKVRLTCCGVHGKKVLLEVITYINPYILNSAMAIHIDKAVAFICLSVFMTTVAVYSEAII